MIISTNASATVYRPLTLIILLGLFGLCPLSHGAGPLRIAVGEFLPCLSDSLPGQGSVMRLIREAFALKGREVEFVFLPWLSAYKETENGGFAATGIWLKKPERVDSFWFSETIIKEKHVFFHLKARPFEWKVLADLHGRRLGGFLGDSYGQELDTAITAGQVVIERVNNDKQNFRKRLSGRIDLLPQDMAVGCPSLHAMFSTDEAEHIMHAPNLFLDVDNYLLLPKSEAESEAWLADFNAALKQLRLNGRYRQLIGAPAPP